MLPLGFSCFLPLSEPQLTSLGSEISALLEDLLVDRKWQIWQERWWCGKNCYERVVLCLCACTYVYVFVACTEI